MYRPKPYVVDDKQLLHRLIHAHNFALAAAVIDGEAQFAYAPVVLDAEDGPCGSLRFHLARANPLTEIDGKKVRFGFIGPNAYVSPDWYATEGLVPTWNYIAIEATGTAERLAKDGLEKLLVDLSAVHEERLLPKTPWTLGKVPAKKLDALLAAIVGFRVPLDTLEGKFKLSQDKSQQDFDGVVAALEKSADPIDRAVAESMLRARKAV